MKKISEQLGRFCPGFKKLLLIMRLSILLILMAVFSSTASVYSQVTKLTLKMDNARIADVFDAIENQTEFFFFYNRDYFNDDQIVSVDVKDKKIEEVLESLFKGQEVNYEIFDRNILIKVPAIFPGISRDEQQQQQPISGRVTDSGGQPLPGVTVVVKGTTQGAVTNGNGEYSITNIPEDATLVFSFVGMRTQEIPVAGKTQIDVTLAGETIGIEEVVAIGYGTQKKVNLTGSVASISSEEITKRPVANVAQMLQGKLGGVNIVSNSGQPGNEGISINIRGVNSYGTDNTPIVLVDGVAGNLNYLDPDNIESISVLKDASSAAIYGSRAANGVILVTTKKGKAGVFSLEYHSNFAIHSPTRLPDLVNDPVEYMTMFNIAAENSGLGYRYTDQNIQLYRSGEVKGFNWDDAVFQSPLVQKHNLTITGGSEKVRFNFAGGYWDQDGVVLGSSYKRYNVRFTIDSDINEYISFGANIGVVKGDRKDTFLGAEDLILCTYASLPTYAAKLANGKPVLEAFDWEQHNSNPVTIAENGGIWEDTYGLLGKTYLRVNPIKGLTWETTAGVKYDHSYYKKQSPATLEYNYITGDFAGYVDNTSVIKLEVKQPFETLFTLFSTLNYQNTIQENHNFKILAGYSQESFVHNYLNGFRKDFPSEMLVEINAGSGDGQTVSGSSYEWALQSFFGRGNYDYKGKYLLEVNFRYDGSSRFAEGNRWGFFPSFSAGWRLSEEDFMKDIKWLSNFKIRGSWGQLGNQLIGNYPYQSVYKLGYSYSYDDASLNAGTIQTSLTNKDISWELTRITDIGFDLDILGGLFSATFDYYDKETVDILRASQVMGHVGLSAPIINDGEMKNTGFDFVASHHNRIGEFSYDVALNFSKYKNKVTKLGAQEIGGYIINKEGLSYNSWYMYEFDGIFQSQQDIDDSPSHFYSPTPGDIKLKDQDGDGDIDGDDRRVFSGRYPDFSYGININLQWKHFDLTTFIQGVQGVRKYSELWGIAPFVQGSRPPVKWRDAWSPTNPTNELPKLFFGLSDTNNRQVSSFWLQDASYVRLKNIQLGYNLPEHILKNIGIEGLRLYFSGDNLLTFTNYEGTDPEINKTSTRFANYPQVKVYSFGIKAKF